MRLALILSPPVLRTAGDAEEERSASWLELFFDLVFVVALAQLAVALAEDLSPGGFLRFGLLFVPVWWAWTGYTMYADRFDTDDLVFRVMMLAGMLAIATLAVGVPKAFSGGSAAFALSYMAVRVILILLYERARRNVPSARALCKVTMSVFVVGTALWAVSLLVGEPLRFALWALALFIEGATPWLARRAMSGTPVHASHLPERFGLFTIIVLGESMVAVVVGLDGTDWRADPALAATAGFAVAAALWWLYFDSIGLADIRRGLLARNVFIYSHLSIALGLTAAGVGVKKAIKYAGETALPAGAVWALCGGTVLFLASLSLIHAVSTLSARDRIVLARVVATVAALCLGAVGTTVPSALFVGLLLLVLVFLIVYETAEKARRTVNETGSASDPTPRPPTDAPKRAN